MDKDAKHKASMKKQKTNVDASIAAADTEKSLVLLLTGNGKGKTSSAFGMVMRAMGYGQRVRTWAEAARMLHDPAYDLVVLDEITYMLSFDYLDEAQVIKTVEARPEHQSVVLTGRGGGSGLQTLADTVSEVKEVKHAFRAGIKARKGVDY